MIAPLIVGCATSHHAAEPAASDASADDSQAADDAPPDLDANHGKDATPDAGEPDARAESDATDLSLDYCDPDAGSEAGASCTPGEVERGRCGSCGVRQRSCDSLGVWRDWSPCSEADDAECAPCSVTEAGCGFCGKRVLQCRIVADSCRWQLGTCDAGGACSPGSFESDASACPPGFARVRWCGTSCAWEPWQPCTDRVPVWQDAGDGPSSERSAFLSVHDEQTWLVWGGRDSLGTPLGDGAVYDGATGTWSAIPEATAIEPRSNAAGVWTGELLLVWGGQGAGTDTLGDGAKYARQDGSWSAMAVHGAPSPRADAAAVWDANDDIMMVWGGRTGSGAALSNGARYSVSSDTWTAMSDSALSPRLGASVVWDPTRSRLVVWGGRAGGSVRRDGAIYDVASDSWSGMADAPIARAGHVAFWDAPRDRMVVLFGQDGFWTGDRGDGAAWKPATGTWTMISDVSISGYTVADGFAVSVSSGHVWVTGGDAAGYGAPTSRGARYDLANDAWSALPDLVRARSGHGSAFVGNLVVWGGRPGASGWIPSTERLRYLP